MQTATVFFRKDHPVINSAREFISISEIPHDLYFKAETSITEPKKTQNKDIPMIHIGNILQLNRKQEVRFPIHLLKIATACFGHLEKDP